MRSLISCHMACYGSAIPEDGNWIELPESLNQAFPIIFTSIQFNEPAHGSNSFCSQRIRIAIPCFQKKGKRLFIFLCSDPLELIEGSRHTSQTFRSHSSGDARANAMMSLSGGWISLAKISCRIPGRTSSAASMPLANSSARRTKRSLVPISLAIRSLVLSADRGGHFVHSR